MIRKIKAIIEDIEDEIVLIKFGNITLEAYPSFKVLQNLKVGEEYDLYAFLETNEWNTSLYIFKEKIERDVFESLKKVSKIGPRTAAKILKKISADILINMINLQDLDGLSKLPGIGRKTAERLISELSNAFQDVKYSPEEVLLNINVKEAIEALEALGFQRYDILKVINDTELKNMKTEDIIKVCLTKL
ncbi:Holliday junction branch migration protein RuvA [Petrotoga sp. 9PWA.NaAc.5.4]|uniref:Holliday junction branch migration protein RuvA n=1 Tax=Petrotoga sp. 9PWA.NaAc.5.4 TaxID=1434328 RepID=UPI000CA68887|nr:Holliday junction branch migration protein RuvA [Petrotoga sp. 9PWA.NaAc.5.4]PNR95636.1 ATP-dependent DNA helicase RuvA [Petrotoga sp. 9PWA.NaAc.5.4]